MLLTDHCSVSQSIKQGLHRSKFATLPAATWFQLVEVCKCSIQFFLCALQILTLHCQCLGFILFLCCLVFDVSRLCRLVNFGVSHEGVIFLLSSSLCCLSVGLKPSKVGLDDLQHSNHTSVLRLHAFVW